MDKPVQESQLAELPLLVMWMTKPIEELLTTQKLAKLANIVVTNVIEAPLRRVTNVQMAPQQNRLDVKSGSDHRRNSGALVATNNT